MGSVVNRVKSGRCKVPADMTCLTKALLMLPALSVLACNTALARDLPARDPVRKDIIAAVRQSPEMAASLRSVKLDVRRIWASEQHAYLCALPIDARGHYRLIDGWHEVYQMVLVRQDDRWQLAARIDGLSEVLRNVQCLADEHGQINDAFLASLVQRRDLQP